MPNEIWKDKIKQDAIKHTKFLENKENVLANLTNGGSTATSEREAYAVRYWIKHFFNITEEEIK